jgi:hypothetical protein
LAAGDHSLTALAIGRMLGIAGNGIVFTGPELDRLTSDALRALVKECNVFARASPENKLKIVRALQVHAVTASDTPVAAPMLASRRTPPALVKPSVPVAAWVVHSGMSRSPCVKRVQRHITGFGLLHNLP